MKLTIKEIAIFGMLGAVMYASKIIMELVPNVHLIGVFTVAFTVVSYLHICHFKWRILRICHMVDSIFICMDGSLGGRHAFAKGDAEKNTTLRVHGGVCGSRFFIRDVVRPGADNPLWVEF